MYLIAEWCIGLHDFEGSFNFKTEVGLRDINKVIPERMLVMFEEESFEVLLIGLCGDEQHNEAIVCITVMFFVYAYGLPAILSHVVFADQPHLALI